MARVSSRIMRSRRSLSKKRVTACKAAKREPMQTAAITITDSPFLNRIDADNFAQRKRRGGSQGVAVVLSGRAPAEMHSVRPVLEPQSVERGHFEIRTLRTCPLRSKIRVRRGSWWSCAFRGRGRERSPSRFPNFFCCPHFVSPLRRQQLRGLGRELVGLDKCQKQTDVQPRRRRDVSSERSHPHKPARRH